MAKVKGKIPAERQTRWKDGAERELRQKKPWYNKKIIKIWIWKSEKERLSKVSSVPGSSCQVAFSRRSSEKDKGVQCISEGVGVQPARILKLKWLLLRHNPGSSLTCTLLLQVNNERDTTLAEISAEQQPRSARGESCRPARFPDAEEVALRARSLTSKSLNYKTRFWNWWWGNHSSWLAPRNEEAQHLLLALLLDAGVIFQAYRSAPASPSPMEVAKGPLTSMDTCWFMLWLPLNWFSSSFSWCWLVFYRFFCSPCSFRLPGFFSFQLFFCPATG